MCTWRREKKVTHWKPPPKPGLKYLRSASEKLSLFFLHGCTHSASSPLIPPLGTQHSPASIITANLLNEQQAAQIIIILMGFMVMGWCARGSGEEWKWAAGAEDCCGGQVLNLFQYLIPADSPGAPRCTRCASLHPLWCRQEAAGSGKRVMVVDRAAASPRGAVRGECFILTASLLLPLCHAPAFCFSMFVPIASVSFFSPSLSLYQTCLSAPFIFNVFCFVSFQVSSSYIISQMYLLLFLPLFLFALIARTRGLRPRRLQEEISPAGVFVGKSSSRCSEILLEGGR